MMKLALLALAAVTAAPLGAETPTPRYDFQVRVLEGNMVLGTPRLIAKSGELAKMTADDGHGQGWEVDVTGTPDAVASRVSVNVRADRWGTNTGTQTHRTIKTTMSVDEGKPTSVEVKASNDAPAVRVELSVRAV